MIKKFDSQQVWIEVKREYHLSDTVIQMAQRLGLNPKKFGSIANHKQEKWKEPLPSFIKTLYETRFN